MDTTVGAFRIAATLHDSPRTRVVRATQAASGTPVVLKILKTDAATEDALAQFERERALTTRLAGHGVIGVAGVTRVEAGEALVLEDIGGETLDALRCRYPLPLPACLDIAIALADTLAWVHDHRVVHRDVNPAHIVANLETGEVRLIDFGAADELPERLVGWAPPAALHGVLAYISPEQTGRTNRPVDQRTDLYSLGMVLYEMATGRLPFEAQDALGLVHCHLAAVPASPASINPALPDAFARIVLKLLAKAPEDRYQGAAGLRADLERCRDALRLGQAVEPFELGLADAPAGLQVPRRLYGRDREILQLRRAVDRAAQGTRELLLVSGPAGVGKTALVLEARTAVIPHDGHFVEGRFDELRRGISYLGWAQALEQLVTYLLMESEEALATVRARVLEALGSGAAALTSLVPKLELVIGPQPSIPTPDAVGTQHRLLYLLQEFVKAVASRERPLVVFLDDLQWVDEPSRVLLESLLVRDDVSGLLVVGAYRDTGLDPYRSLWRELRVLGEEGAPIRHLTLDNLALDEIAALLADALRQDATAVRPLAEAIHQATAGNPFFVHQALLALADQGTLRFDPQAHAWIWDRVVLSAPVTGDDVVGLLLRRIRRLDAPTRRLLGVASCIGYRFDEGTLVAVAGLDDREALASLQGALRQGLIALDGEGWRFAHDRVQHAAATLVPEGEARALHLAIGHLLWPRLEREGEELLFSVVDHLNLATPLLETRAQRLDLARLDLRAGRRAKASAAFAAAARYFDAGLRLLPPDAWATEYALTLDLHDEAAEAASLTGDFAHTDDMFSAASAHAMEADDLIGVYRARIDGLMARGLLQDALDCGLELLDRLDVHLPRDPGRRQVRRSLDETIAAYQPVGIASLGELPRMTDERQRRVVRVLDLAVRAAYSGRPNLFAMLVFELVRRTIRWGLADESMYGFTCLALLLGHLPGGRIEDAAAFGELALALAERSTARQLVPRVVATTVGMTWHYTRPLRDTLPALEPWFQRAREVGDVEHAGYVACWHGANAYLAGVELGPLEERLAAYDATNRMIHAEVARRWLNPFWQAVQNLLGKSPTPWVLKGDAFDADAMLPELQATNNVAAMSVLHANSLVLCYLFGRHEEALAASQAVEATLIGLTGMAMFPVWHLYDSLTRLALCSSAGPDERRTHLARVARNQTYLRGRADHAPANYEHAWRLVEGELARVRGDRRGALEQLRLAASLARERGFVQDEALAEELTGRLWAEDGCEDYARLHLQRAHRAYGAWQAWAKVRSLEEAHPWLADDAAPAEPGPVALDLDTVIKASHAISSEMQLDRLLAAILRIVIENAGAQRGFVLLEQDGTWSIAARGEVGRAEVELLAPGDVDPDDVVPGAVVRFVVRTRELVVLDDAVRVGAFTADPLIRQERTRSVLCTPLLSRGRLVAILYLANDLAPGAFTPERVRLIEMLAAQAAASLENAQVFEALRASEEQNRRIVSTADEGIVVLAEDGRTLRFLNARMAEMLGAPAEQLIGRPFTDFFEPGEEGDHWQRMEARRGGVSEHYERRFRRADGESVWTLASATPIFDATHEFRGSFGMFTDITERKLAEQQLALVSHAFNTVGEAAFLIDHEGRLRLVNDEACRALGYSRDELLVMRVADVDPDFPQERWPAHWQNLQRERSQVFETRHRARDGSILPVEINASYFEYAGEAHVLALARNISERMRSRETIRRLNTDLEATIAAIPDLMFELDREGRYVAVHAHDPALLAAPAEDLIGRRLDEVLPPDAVAESMAGIREAEALGKSHGRVVRLELAGGVRWFEQSIARKAVADGQEPRFVSLSRDVTERVEATEALRRAAEELRQSEERYRLVFDNVRESLYLLEVTPDGHFRNLEVNPALAASAGIPREQMVGRTQEEVVGPEVAAQVNLEFADCAARGEIVQTHKELDLPGGLRVYDTTLIPVRNEEGRVDRIVGISHDVTERELAQRARQASELTYRTLLEQASEAIFVSDADRRYTDVNVAACEMLGYTRDELLAMRVEDVTPPDANNGQEDRFRRMMAGETVVSERMLRAKDGRLIPTELSTRRLPDGRFLAMGRDITERRLAQQEQARLAAAVEQAAEAILIADPSGRIIYVNPAFEHISGYERPELIGRNPRMLQSGQHDAAFYRSMWDTLLAGGTWHGTLVNRRKDGTLYEEDSSIRPIHDEAGELVSYVGVKRDVTRERALEAQLRQAQKMEAIGQLAGGIAHDFNNLITAIRGYAELLRDKLPSPMRDDGDLDQVVLAADRAADLTRQLLAFSRRLPLQPRVVAVADVVERLAPMLRRLLGEHIELQTAASSGAGRVLVDPSQLEQVIVNLAVNARDAMPDGGRLHVEVEDVVLEADEPAGHPDLPAGPYVTLRVADTGTGMSEETRLHAFEPFYTTKEAGKGTGMGLATVYGIVAASGGAIYLYSEQGRGTTFRIYLPQVAEGEAPIVSVPAGTAPGGTETVLLVEDEPGVRAFARRSLEGLGYTVVEAADGEEAAALVAAGTAFDLLVSDVVMPRLGGPALLERLRRDRPGVRAVLMSGFAEDRLDGVDVTTDVVFLAKPFSREALAHAARRALEGVR